MTNEVQLDEEKIRVFEKATVAMAEFRRAFNRDLKPDSIAELYVCKRLGLNINLSPYESGFDAIDSFGKRYQIKYRRAQNVDVNNFNFEYIILVNLDDNYQPAGMWRITSDQAKKLFTPRPKFRKSQVTQKKFKNIAERII